MGIVSLPFPTLDFPTAAAQGASTRSVSWHRCAAVLAGAVLLLGGLPGLAPAQSLRGSRSSLDRQVAQARQHDFSHLANAGQVRRFVDAGYLVPISGNRDYTLHDVSFPFARPEVRLFVERLATQYRRACGEQLVVTSLTRPRSHQPRNASSRSVHPTGMAIDLRRPAGRCRAWLEGVLLSLEARGVLEATAERRPPHYHVAVFPKPYAAYVEQLAAEAGAGAGASAALSAARAAPDAPASSAAPVVHVVRRGETLGRIARRHGASVDALRRANGLTSSVIHPGQTLRVPGARPSAAETRVGAGASDSPAEARALPGAPASSAAPVVHVVRRGETLGRIARRHGASVDALRRANGLTSSVIHPGQTLQVPGARSSASSSAAPVVHVVRRGETLGRIARRHGASVDALRRANGLASSVIHPGQTLRVPGARSSGSGAGAGAGAAASSAQAVHGAPASSAAPVVHVVRRGESLTRIARRHGASVDALRRANGLASSVIHPGQTLRVPPAQP